MQKVSQKLKDNVDYMQEQKGIKDSFDIVYRKIMIGERDAAMFLVDGFCKDEMMQKFLQFLMELKAEDMPANANEMAESFMPYVEIDVLDDLEKIKFFLLSGSFLLFIDGFDQCILIDSRTYPARSVDEPEKDKSLRGSRDGFVETIIFNTALIRRRIRSSSLRMEMMNAGTTSKTDIVLCYMEDRSDAAMVQKLKERIQSIKIDALTMNQESLAEAIYQRKWFNPYPKFKYTERPDTAAAEILDGGIIILVDNSPNAMILPVSLFDIMEEADDYYFPPVTGTYLRISRMLIALLSYIITPRFLLFMNHPEWIPKAFEFIMVKETVNIPLIFQLLILELAIDGLRLAAVNTPNMLSTPLSVLSALVIGEFSVKSGWFNAEIMLYMAFVAIANYTQSNYELGYAVKFQRILTLILTAVFGLYGYIAGIVFGLCALIFNRTIFGKGYLYPLLPLDLQRLKRRFLRLRQPRKLN